MSEKKDSVSITATTGKPVSLLEQAREIQEYTPEDRDKIYKILDKLSTESSRLSGIGGKTQMLQRKIFSLENEAKGISAQTDPQKAAQQILEIGSLYKKMQEFQSEADRLRAEYTRIMALANAANRPQVSESGVYKLDGSEKIARALS